MPRRSKASIRKSEAMKESWKKRKAAKKVTVTQDVAPVKRMKVRVISHQDGIKLDEYEIDTIGELIDILTSNYLGIVMSEVLIQTNSTLL